MPAVNEELLAYSLHPSGQRLTSNGSIEHAPNPPLRCHHNSSVGALPIRDQAFPVKVPGLRSHWRLANSNRQGPISWKPYLGSWHASGTSTVSDYTARRPQSSEDEPHRTGIVSEHPTAPGLSCDGLQYVVILAQFHRVRRVRTTRRFRGPQFVTSAHPRHRGSTARGTGRKHTVSGRR
jgi:hypothetical protein